MKREGEGKGVAVVVVAETETETGNADTGQGLDHTPETETKEKPAGGPEAEVGARAEIIRNMSESTRRALRKGKKDTSTGLHLRSHPWGKYTMAKSLASCSLDVLYSWRV